MAPQTPSRFVIPHCHAFLQPAGFLPSCQAHWFCSTSSTWEPTLIPWAQLIHFLSCPTWAPGTVIHTDGHILLHPSPRCRDYGHVPPCPIYIMPEIKPKISHCRQVLCIPGSLLTLRCEDGQHNFLCLPLQPD